MDDWPFRQNEGRFEALARVGDAELDYVPGWPRAQGIDATARFTGVSMAVEGLVRNVGGVEVQGVTAVIPDLKAPLLQVQYTAQSAGSADGLHPVSARATIDTRLPVRVFGLADTMEACVPQAPHPVKWWSTSTSPC
jgi:uncharacterized protein YhdP